MRKLQLNMHFGNLLWYNLLHLNSGGAVDLWSCSFKSHLKEWIKSFIRVDGDDILNGKVKCKARNDDWLRKEVTDWRDKQKYDEESITQLQKLEDENGEERISLENRILQ